MQLSAFFLIYRVIKITNTIIHYILSQYFTQANIFSLKNQKNFRIASAKKT